jgi:hypothetical protein
MRAFVEWLYQPPSGLEGAVGLLRVGPKANKFGDPYDGAITFRVENGLVDCKGLHNYLGQCPACGSTINLSRAHVVAGLRELRDVTGLDIHWMHKGKETLMTSWNHDPHGSDGKLDAKKLDESLKHGEKTLRNGTELLLDAMQVGPGGTMPPPPTDGSYYTIYHHVPAATATAAQKAAALKVPGHGH